jgi:phage virion morphogenesis protein
MNELNPFGDKLAGLLAALSPEGRRRLTVGIAKKLRQRQQQRIKSQKDPSGAPYAKRKTQPIRGKKGRIKREMFAKLRTNRYMKASGDYSVAVVEFTGKVQRIARVHQLGLKDRPEKNSKEVSYPIRTLLDFSTDDIETVHDVIIEHFSEL